MKKRILIVEDDKASLELMAIQLSIIFDKNIKIDKVECGEEALQKISHNKYGFAFVDFWLPIVDGGKLCDAIKEKNPDCKICLMTAAMHVIDNKNIDLILYKPIDMKKLESFIKDFDI